MIIGISGKIGSGKDTIAKIIQVLTGEYQSNHYGRLKGEQVFETLGYTKEALDLINPEGNYPTSGWEIRKYAEKLKQVVSMFTGIPRAELEWESVKSRILPDEWQVWEIYNFGSPVYANNKYILNLPTEFEATVFCQDSSNSQHNYTYKKTERTVRWLLKTMGTDAFRDAVHESIHVNGLFADYEDKVPPGSTEQTTQWLRNKTISKWLITDVRFPNEANPIKDKKGILIRTNRLLSLGSSTKIDMHPSEVGLDNYAGFNYEINNNGTMEDLIRHVKTILLKEKII